MPLDGMHQLRWVKSDTLGLLRDRGGKLIVTRPAREYPNVAKILATSCKYLKVYRSGGHGSLVGDFLFVSVYRTYYLSLSPVFHLLDVPCCSYTKNLF